MFTIDDLSSAISAASKLNKFRGHPDWQAAFELVLQTHDELYIDHPEYGRCIPDANVHTLGELADKAFIEAIEDHTAVMRLFRKVARNETASHSV